MYVLRFFVDVVGNFCATHGFSTQTRRQGEMKLISERQWRNLNRKLNGIRETVRRLEDELPQKPKRWLHFEECIPPASVCRDISSMLDGISSYTGFLGRLAEYYGCSSMGFYVDEKIDPKYKAIYYPNLKKAASRTPTIGRNSVLHEWFHHLVNENVVVVDGEEEEKFARKYAEIFMLRGETE